MGALQKLLTDAYAGPGAYDAAQSAKFRAMLNARRRITAVPLTDEVLAAGHIDSDLVNEYRRGSVRGWYSPSTETAYYPPGDRATRRHEVMHGIHDEANRFPMLSAAVPSWARSRDGATAAGELLARLAGGRDQVINWNTGYYAKRFPDEAAGFRAMGVPVRAARTMIGDFGSEPVLQGGALTLLAGPVAAGGAKAGLAIGEALVGEPQPDPAPVMAAPVALRALTAPPKPKVVKTEDGWVLLEED